MESIGQQDKDRQLWRQRSLNPRLAVIKTATDIKTFSQAAGIKNNIWR
jgi:hypothetical protein